MENIFNYKEFISESLIRSNSLRQLEEVKRLSKGTDIGEKTNDSKFGNTICIKNPIDSLLDTYEDQQEENKKFSPN